VGEGSPLGPILERWNQLPRGRQFALAGIVAGTIVVLYFVLTSSSQANLVVAYTGLAPEDSAAVADELERQGIAFEIGGGGSTVSVAAGNVAEARMMRCPPLASLLISISGSRSCLRPSADGECR